MTNSDIWNEIVELFHDNLSKDERIIQNDWEKMVLRNYLGFGKTDIDSQRRLRIGSTDKKIDIFGLFSGEGGPEVAKYICNIFPEKIKSNNNFKEGKYPEAIKETFLEVDNLIVLPQFKVNGNRDEETKELFKKIFPDRIIETIDYNEVAVEGGLLNCSTWTIKE